ncbi:MAG: UDP-N-acetylmuramoyl-L-alanine--D-glutamate ligase [Clostridia bacterium]|jgi:UDP-N-acetylmuramoylalanine--D-glutamate ligase
MDIRDKKVLVIGLAVSGLQTVKVLHGLGAHVKANDLKSEVELKEAISAIKGPNVDFVLGGHPSELADWPDFAVISPGIPMDLPMVQRIRESGREVISEVELAYRLTATPIVAITGTNGKTTTTALTGEMFRRSGRNTHVVGNIGTPLVDAAVFSQPSDILVAEISSFQLEGTRDFKPRAAAVLNITPDHLDRHKTFDNYTALKARVFQNQGPDDFAVFNADDPAAASLADRCSARVLHFSRKRIMDTGAFVEEGYIIIKRGKSSERVCKTSDLRIMGDHNLENALAAAALAWSMEVPVKAIGDALKDFEGVEHRLEYVDTVNGVIYINDSKGTNPDASARAVKAMDRPIVLIAGGYDKGGDFDEFVEGFGDKVKGVVLLGTTAEKLKRSCQRVGLNNIYMVKNMREAVERAALMAEEGDAVLLSPACASWDMYNNFEERGKDFKKAVGMLRRIT